MTELSENNNWLTVHSPLFFRKIVRIECLSVRATILVSYVPRGWVSGRIQDGRPQSEALDFDDLTEKWGTVNSLDGIMVLSSSETQWGAFRRVLRRARFVPTQLTLPSTLRMWY